MHLPKVYDEATESISQKSESDDYGFSNLDKNSKITDDVGFEKTEDQSSEVVQDSKYNLNKRSTFYITALSNKLTQHATTLLKKDFNIGLVDWRCIATLGDEKSCSATMICKISGMNKSLVSQSLSNLRELKYVVPDEGSVCRNPEMLTLSESGAAIHQEIIKKVCHFEAELTDGLSENERAEFIRMLTHVYNKMKSS